MTICHNTSVSILRQLKQLYYRLPLTPAMRHRLGLFKRRLVGAPGKAPGIYQSGVPGVAPGIAQDVAPGNPHSIQSDFSIGPFAEVPADIGHTPRFSSDSQVKLATDLIPETVAVFYGVIDWHFRHQRPQQLALSLARRGWLFSTSASILSMMQAQDSELKNWIQR